MTILVIAGASQFTALQLLSEHAPLFIAILAIVPAIVIAILLSGQSANIGQNFGGTSLLIAVGVALETMKQIDGQLMMRNYEGFLGAK